MRVVAILLSVWAGWRWVGFLLGLLRVRRFRGPARREARRAVVGRGAFNVLWSVVAFYAWVDALAIVPTQLLIGFIAGTLMVTLVVGVTAGFMQPAERTPETLGICRLRWTAPPADGHGRATEEPSEDEDAP